MKSNSERVIRPPKRLISIDLKELWTYRELAFMLVLREVQGKYRQSALGFLWAVIPPVLQMVIFTVVFGKVAKLGPDGIPYPIFSFAALLPWTFFSRALSGAGASLLSRRALLSKVYFPRLVLPISGVVAALFDFAIASIIMMLLMIWYQIIPGWQILLLPFFIVIAIITALGVGLWLSTLSVKYRDVGFVTPFFVQMWMFVTPVIFSVDKIPDKYQFLLWLNPMTGVIEGFRWSLLGQSPPSWWMVGLSLGVVFLILISGALYFKNMEKTFADII